MAQVPPPPDPVAANLDPLWTVDPRTCAAPGRPAGRVLVPGAVHLQSAHTQAVASSVTCRKGLQRGRGLPEDVRQESGSRTPRATSGRAGERSQGGPAWRPLCGGPHREITSSLNRTAGRPAPPPRALETRRAAGGAPCGLWGRAREDRPCRELCCSSRKLRSRGHGLGGDPCPDALWGAGERQWGFKSHMGAFWDRAGQNAAPPGQGCVGTSSRSPLCPAGPRAGPAAGLPGTGQGAGCGHKREGPGLRVRSWRVSPQEGSRPSPSAGTPRHKGRHSFGCHLVTVCPCCPVSSPGVQWGDCHYPNSGGRNCSHRGQGQADGHCSGRPESPHSGSRAGLPSNTLDPLRAGGAWKGPSRLHSHARCCRPGITWPGKAPSLH